MSRQKSIRVLFDYKTKKCVYEIGTRDLTVKKLKIKYYKIFFDFKIELLGDLVTCTSFINTDFCFTIEYPPYFLNQKLALIRTNCSEKFKYPGPLLSMPKKIEIQDVEDFEERESDSNEDEFCPECNNYVGKKGSFIKKIF